tara:strand:+ start:64 stop:237 length:174 start_codon:yes stop_codon:yes gene_type:complete
VNQLLQRIVREIRAASYDALRSQPPDEEINELRKELNAYNSKLKIAEEISAQTQNSR